MVRIHLGATVYMLTKRIIPCLDVNQGRVVKGIKFLELRDAGDPVEAAKKYNDQGADELVFLDITASHEQRKTILHVVERTAEEVFMPLTVGGGIRTLDDIHALLQAGADKVSINTTAIQNPNFIQQAAERFGSQCIVLAIDAKKNPNDKSWQVYTHGGRNATGLDAIAWAQKGVAMGAGEILLTSMDADGTKQGYDIALTRAVSETVHVPIIASGGAGELSHFYEVLSKGKADAVLAASLFHFGQFTIPQVKTYLKEKALPIRLA